MNKKSILCLLIVHLYCFAPLETITTSGLVTLGDNLTYSPGVSDNIIQIDASDVTLDLGGRIVSQGNATAGVNGIVVSAGRSNIIIRNGTIRSVTGTGIQINQTCTNVFVSNINFISCNTRAIDFAGAASPNDIINSEITGCRILNCLTNSGVGDFIIRLNQCTRTKISNVIINSSGNTAINTTMLQLNTCTQCDVTDFTASGNTGSTATGIDLIAPTRCTLTNCLIRENSSVGVTAPFNGIILSGASNVHNVISNCTVLRNNSTSNHTSFNIQANSQNNLFTFCRSLNNNFTGGTANPQSAGFAFLGTTADNLNNTVQDSIVSGNTGSGLTALFSGIYINGSSSGVVLRCVVVNNSTSNGVSGLFFQAAASGTNWQIQDNIFSRNNAGVAANSFGINGTGTSCLFLRNVAYNNGTTVANQTSGFPANNRQTVLSTNISTATLPWTNVSGTP